MGEVTPLMLPTLLTAAMWWAPQLFRRRLPRMDDRQKADVRAAQRAWAPLVVVAVLAGPWALVVAVRLLRGELPSLWGAAYLTTWVLFVAAARRSRRRILAMLADLPPGKPEPGADMRKRYHRIYGTIAVALFVVSQAVSLPYPDGEAPTWALIVLGVTLPGAALAGLLFLWSSVWVFGPKDSRARPT